MADYTQDIQSGLSYLVYLQNKDGGWGYKPGGQSFTEATAWAILALAGPEATAPTVEANERAKRRSALEQGVSWLRINQHSDGGWGVNPADSQSCWMTAYGVWTLAVLRVLNRADAEGLYGASLVRDATRPALVVEADTKAIEQGRAFLINTSREHATTDPAVRASILKTLKFDSNYRGFCWNPSEAGWVIPAGVALPAIMIDAPQNVKTEVITNTKEYLRDRQCVGRGWNIGNPYSGDVAMPPIPDCTAFALFGLRAAFDISDNVEAIQGGLDALKNMVVKSNSAQTRAIGAIAYRLFTGGAFLNETRQKLSDQRGTTKPNQKAVSENLLESLGWLNNPYTTALAVLALSDSLHFMPSIAALDIPR